MSISKSTGQAPEGRKDDGGKTPTELLAPDAMWAVADVLKHGAKKYAEWNWYQGINYSRIFGATLRHLWQWWRGEEYDQESGLHHLAHAGCEIMFLLQFVLERRKELDNRPKWRSSSYFVKTQTIEGAAADITPPA